MFQASIRTQLTEYELKGLEKYTEYSVRVQAVNAKDAGDSTPILFFRTQEDSESCVLGFLVLLLI